MTTDKVKAKIHALCPDVLELKFGCEVDVLGDLYTVLFHDAGGKSFDGENTEYYGPVTMVTTGEVITEIWGDSAEATHEYPLKSNMKVLGSPITLATVIRAYHERSDFPDNDASILGIVNRWRLADDNYDAQNEQTKQYIGALLGVV